MDPHAARVVLRLFLGGLASCVIVLGILHFSGVAKAQQRPPCGPHAAITAQLIEKYQEAQVARGVVNESVLMELWISPQGSWTVLNTNGEGGACIVTSGEDGFEFVAPEVPKTGQGS